MRITRSADWRAALRYDVPAIVADVLPGDPARCTSCGLDSEPLPRTDLWAVKHAHPNDPAGVVRFYCRAHVPEPPRPARTAAPVRERKAPARRSPLAPEKPAILCPDCFVEVPPTGVCGMCGERIA